LDLGLNLTGTNKRLLGLLPLPAKSGTHELSWSNHLDPVEVLASAELKRLSGVVRVISDKHKFRSAMLLFKGRVVGCMHSQLGSNGVSTDEQARKAFLESMYESFTLVDVYRLDPDLVLAAGAFFYSTADRARIDSATPDFVLGTIKLMLENLQTGCTTINTKDGTIGTVYTRLGAIVGVYSFKEGWLPADIDSVEYCLESGNEYDIFVSTVPMMYEDEFEQFLTRPASIAAKCLNKNKRCVVDDSDVLNELVSIFPPMEEDWRPYVASKRTGQ
jgi:hypothetical protein